MVEEKKSTLTEKMGIPEPAPVAEGIDVSEDLLGYLHVKRRMASNVILTYNQLEEQMKLKNTRFAALANGGAREAVQTLTRYTTIIDLVEERRKFGIKKYGQSLRSKDGRDDVVEAMQEAADLLQYSYKAALNGRAEELSTVLLPLLDTVREVLTKVKPAQCEAPTEPAQ